MKRDTPHILLVNPWIHDFAAYDFWAKPLGLLTLASILRYHGFNITYIVSERKAYKFNKNRSL